jgi:heme exporter protein A
MLSATGLSLWRGNTCLFSNLGFDAPAGSALLVRGPNGSGKTTLLRVIAGLTLPEAGEVRWGGSRLRAGGDNGVPILAYCGHAMGLKADLSVRENLDFVARLLRTPAGRIEAAVEACGLGNCASLLVRYLSAGQRRRTALARVLLSPARLWLLDEPQTNLDADGRELVARMLTTHLRFGGTAVIAAHQDVALDELPVATLTMGESQ